MANGDCCTECFDDEFLKSHIGENGETGNCDFCGAENVKCVFPYDLNELFGQLIDLYEVVDIGVNITPDEDPTDLGESLAECLQNDWEIFSEKLGDRGDELLNEIVNALHKQEDESDVKDLWTEKANAFEERSLTDLWQGFAYTLRYERRYIPKPPELGESADPRDLLKHALPKIESTIPATTEVFRARLTRRSSDHKPLGVDEMGAPPPEKTRAGRMNPPGIVYLYVARSEDTAISEVRPWKGAYVSVARFELPHDLMVADLTKDLDINPFTAEDLASEVGQQELLRFLGRQFAKPIDPEVADIEYVPTQYLTELFQGYGYEAILYPSALGTSPNLVIFDHSSLTPQEVRLREVKEVTYEVGDPLQTFLLDDF